MVTVETEDRAATAAEAARSLEDALARAQADAEATLRAANSLVGTLKKYRKAASEGNVGDLRAAAEAAAQSLRTLDQAVANLANEWDFDTEGYLESGGYARELIACAEDAGLRISELDGRLYSYPALLRLLPNDRAVQIDKQRERRIRPSVMVKLLQDIQKRPPRFKPADFLESLYAVYGIATKVKPKRGPGSVVPLLELYDLLTPRPGDRREYTRQEFARDVYLLDRSGVTTTRSGARLEFHSGAGARVPAGSVLSIVTQQGTEKKYAGIAFTGPASE